MANFVLDHGSCHGGWCWKKVTPLLSNNGNAVYTPTLTGLGERSHLVSRDIGLDTHILDIIQVLEYEDLNKAILVGHSYGELLEALQIRFLGCKWTLQKPKVRNS
jgi:pimeloyl-ACP methyl ester carboxylesterase